MAEPKEMLMDFLKEEGYFPAPEGDAGIVFKKEGRTYFTIPDVNDPNFFNLYSYFDFAGDIPTRALGLETANDTNKAVKAIKVTLMEEDNPSRVSFGLEVPLTQVEGFRAIFDRSLNTIGYAVEQFAARLRARQAG
jgi:hypothetical protein